jgi:hypothetical protein
MKLTGNTILITGAGSGIGLALGEEFVKLDNIRSMSPTLDISAALRSRCRRRLDRRQGPSPAPHSCPI